MVACVRNGKRETEDAGEATSPGSVTLHLLAQLLADALGRCAAGSETKFLDFAGGPWCPLLSGLAAPVGKRFVIQPVHRVCRVQKRAKNAEGQPWRAWEFDAKIRIQQLRKLEGVRARRYAGPPLQVPGAVGCDLRCQALIRV